MDIEPYYFLLNYSQQRHCIAGQLSTEILEPKFGRLKSYEAITANDACLLPHVSEEKFAS